MNRRIAIIMVCLMMLSVSVSAFSEETDEQVSMAQFSVMEDRNNISTGDILLFGHYEQDNDLTDGPEPIEWTILEKTDSSLMLISNNPLDYKPYNEKKSEVSWAKSSIREWLNADFLETAFYPSELEVILTTDVDNSDESLEGSEWETLGGNNTQDKAYLLSIKEYAQYIDDDAIELSNYVKEQGARGVFSSNATWWLRSPGKTQNNACFAGNGKIESAVVSDKKCIRPVIWIEDTAYDWDEDISTKALRAYDLADQGDYEEAVAISDSLGNYWSSKFFSVYYRLMAGDEERDNGNYEEAIKWYSSAKEFANENYESEDAAQLLSDIGLNAELLECKYQFAVSMKDSGDIDSALEMFAEIGQYKDSMDLLRDCMEQKQIQFSWLTNKIGSAVYTGKDTGYSEINEIKEKNPHFGWGLGRFMISGYTERQDDAELPVFYKTPGDNLILWFNLEQDIDASNGNEKLVIVEDTNGSDQQFQIPKSNFGRGALIIQHTDVKSHEQTEPIIYTDYLAASDDTGADTRVEIKEEGTYRVALDYEIGKKDKIAVVGKTDYYDYRIAFSFEVRNGSNMFYIFDLATQSEMDDYSTTVDGFRIDLANSQSLRIDYTRYTINQSGTALDARRDTITSTKAEFDKVGYYEITVQNKETGKELTKHIFVGRSADLEEYKNVDPEVMKKFG